MPAFDLRYLQVAEYKKKTDGTTEYGDAVSMGDAMTVALEMRFAEGRLYAESILAEYMKKATGGTATAGVKYIPLAAQKLMFRAYEMRSTLEAKSIRTWLSRCRKPPTRRLSGRPSSTTPRLNFTK